MNARIDLLTEHARELVKAPPEWDVYRWEASGRPKFGAEPKVMVIEGAVAPLRTRGPNVGSPNWRKRDKESVRIVYITPDEHRAWVAAWEQRTGKCSQCVGTGKVWSGWSGADGHKWRECRACDGTGQKGERECQT